MANTRRSLGDALAMTPDKLAFIQGPGAQTEAKPIARTEQPKVASIAIGEPIALTDVVATEVVNAQPERPTARASKRPSRERGQSEFNDDAMLSMANLLVPLTTRLQPRTAAALKRAGLEQRLRGRKPSTVQEIAEEAIQKWLQSAGYL